MPLGVVKLDRMAIEEAGPDPERIAASIHMQLALLSGPCRSIRSPRPWTLSRSG
jgi:hypothetical protein